MQVVGMPAPRKSRPFAWARTRPCHLGDVNMPAFCFHTRYRLLSEGRTQPATVSHSPSSKAMAKLRIAPLLNWSHKKTRAAVPVQNGACPAGTPKEAASWHRSPPPAARQAGGACACVRIQASQPAPQPRTLGAVSPFPCFWNTAELPFALPHVVLPSLHLAQAGVPCP